MMLAVWLGLHLIWIDDPVDVTQLILCHRHAVSGQRLPQLIVVDRAAAIPIEDREKFDDLC